MKVIFRIFLWACIVGVYALPALSNVGYSPVNFEYLFAVAIALISAIACASIRFMPRVSAGLLFLLTILSVLLYFGHFILASAWVSACAVIIAFGFSILTLRSFDKVLILSGTVAFSQILSSALAAQSNIHHLKVFPVAHSEQPSVIHLMLDEHAGVAVFPPEAVTPQEIEKFTDDYVKRGFIVFTHAYSADPHTNKSLARLLNLDISVPEDALHGHGEGASILRSTTFDTIGAGRAIDVTNTTWIDFTPALKKNPALARQLVYNINSMGEVINDLPLGLQERLVIATSLSLGWLNKGIESPLTNWFFSTQAGQRLYAKFKFKGNIFAIIARSVLHQFADRLASKGQRGTYYFSHLIFPHRPFLFDKDCRLIPLEEWSGGWSNDSTFDKDAWLKLYKLHFGQASCAASDIFALMESIKKRSELSDAVILLHSDHGSRIIQSGQPSQRDWRGSFIAVRIPGMEGRIVDTPVRLDRFYNNLLENNFKKLDIEKLHPLEDSPY
jgi:hypothetical protein